jgi:hypothetical protein
VHVVREVLALAPEKWVMQVDYINAFNEADRGVAMQEVARIFPEILAWVKTCYGSPSILQFGTEIILSERGFAQGDPLASLLFALVLHPVVLRICQEVPTLSLNVWFLDDGTEIGTLEELQVVADILLEEGPARGLTLSTSTTAKAGKEPKSTVWSPMGTAAAGQDPLGRGIPQVTGLGITLLGASVGPTSFVRRELEARVEKIEAVTMLLPSLKDPHLEFVLLRACLALPKISFILRTTDTSGLTDILAEFDRTTRQALNQILGAPVDGRAWQQAQLPVSMTGMGLRSAEDHAPAAFAASFLASRPLASDLIGRQEGEGPAALAQPVLDLLSAKVGEVMTEESAGVGQKALGLAIDKHNTERLLEEVGEEGEVREVARLASLGLPQAGAWLLTAPILALGLHLQASEFIMAAKYRLGCPVYSSAGPCPACQAPSDRMGDHALCCGHWGERISRHNALRDAIFNTAASAALSPVKEGQFLLPGVGRRPADVYIPGWAGGRDAALDVTVINPLQQDTIVGAAATPGHALQVAHKRKMTGAAEACARQGIAFVPLAFESLGGMHAVTVAEAQKLGAALARHTGQEEGVAIHQLYCRLSILLQKGNAAILANRIPSFPLAQIDGDQDC